MDGDGLLRGKVDAGARRGVRLAGLELEPLNLQLVLDGSSAGSVGRMVSGAISRCIAGGAPHSAVAGAPDFGMLLYASNDTPNALAARARRSS